MAQACRRRPGGGGAAVHTLAGDELHHSGGERPCHSGDLSVGLVAGGNLAAVGVTKRFGIRPALAAAIADAAGLGGRGP